jgi:hypothetical protein
MPVRGAGDRIRNVVTACSGASAHPHRFGGTEFRLAKRELGHIHGDTLVDIPFPTKVRDEVLAAGRAQPHHILPETGWVSFYIREEPDIDKAIELLRLSYDLAIQQRSRRSKAPQA